MSKKARFEEGVSVDPTINMTPEDKALWEEMNQEYGDKFKEADDQARQAAAVVAWMPDFISASEAALMGDPIYRYVRFSDLRPEEKTDARAMWEQVALPYAFIPEHYYYPVSDMGVEQAERVLAIPEDKLENEAYMKSLGYKAPTTWVPEPEKEEGEENPFDEVLRMASAITPAASSTEDQIRSLAASVGQAVRKAAEPSFRVKVLDADTGFQEWVGPASKLLEENPDDEDVRDALDKLKRSGDEVVVGGGAAPLVRLVRL